MSDPSHYFYLHGFASSPQSHKAQYIRQKFAEKGIDLTLPDLNQNDFSNLTLTRQIHQVSAQLPQTPVVMIGSSLGGLTSAWLGEKCPQIERLVLLAPAFGFVSRWLEKLGELEVQKWQETGSLSVYHYGEKREKPIHYSFIHDASQYDEDKLQRSIPTLIIHGKNDDVVPWEYSQAYASKRPWVQFIPLESDHGLTDVLPLIWTEIQSFCFPDSSLFKERDLMI